MCIHLTKAFMTSVVIIINLKQTLEINIHHKLEQLVAGQDICQLNIS